MIVLAAALCVVSLTACGNQKAEAQQQTAQAEAVADLKIGSPAPDIDLPAADGKSVKLSQLYAQGPVFINFWASWCPDCRKDAPNIVALYEKFHKKGVEFLGVSFDRNQESWKKGVEALGLPYTQVSDLKNMRESDVAQAYHISWIPTVYVIDPQGNVALATVMSEKVAAYLTSVFPDCE